MMERLTYRGSESMTEDGLIRPSYSDYTTRRIIEKLAEYKDAEEQGLLLRLPCKVEDTVYCIEDKKIWDCIVNKFTISRTNGVWLEVKTPKSMPDISAIEYTENDFGRTIFLTKEEAEQKLKEMERASDMTIDEAIEDCKESDLWQIAEWLEDLKAIKEMDLDIPQHFTKEQSDWIKAYCIRRNIEFYNKAIDDFVKFANTMPTVEEEDGEIRPMRLEEMAEQLKAGVEND